MEVERTYYLLLHLCIILVSTTALSSSMRANETADHQALLAIKAQIPGDPLSAFASWNQSLHFCQWQGVTCSPRHPNRVAALNLSSLGLAGTLSPQIGNLTFLRVVDLGNNSLSGEIPSEIGNLFDLRYLRLSENSFRGEIPPNVTRCPELRVIILFKNNLTGGIPDAVGSLSNLLQLSLEDNGLSGSIPNSVGNLSSLRKLGLLYNNLQGSIPSELGRLSNLEFLQLTGNNFSGKVPAPLYNISSIYYLSMGSNQLQGTLPADLGFTLPNLQSFFVPINQFHGPIPLSLANATKLERMDFGSNNFTGSLLMNPGNLLGLQILNVFNNSLGTGDAEELTNFFDSISNCSNLQFLDLSANNFRGLLPHSTANLSAAITWLALEENYISGSIPAGIGNLVNLRTLFFGSNMLTGSIPDSIGELSMMEKMFFNINNITGEIPSSIQNLTRIGMLDLHQNSIRGSIPSGLGLCTSLQQMDLSSNHLTGAIPQEIFGLSSLFTLYMHHNFLTGELPPQVGNLKHLGSLTLFRNRLSGGIPSALGSCQDLWFLKVNDNFFEGTIPASFEHLKSLTVLDVSQNNLSGNIPRFLGELPLIQFLNLSHNMFDGEVPDEGVFTNRSVISVEGNKKLCGGTKALQLPACPMEVFKERKRHFSRGVIALLVALPVLLLLICLAGVLYRIRRSKQRPSSAMPLQNQYLQLSYAELLQATNGFSSANLIGEGGYGSVYKGILNSSDQVVAIKVLNLNKRGATKTFIAECEALKNLRHRNLVRIITSCSSIDFKGNDFKALVFEFMGNGSLESWLHPSPYEEKEPKSLSFIQRLNIAIDMASALDYLHHHCENAFVHCDLKPSNILLDNDLCARIGDFGLARILSATSGIPSHQQSGSIGIRGTIGYVAPEYGMGENVSTQADMYSYGVLLLEMFTGRRPTDNMFTDNVDLHSYAKLSLPLGVMEIADPRIAWGDNEEEPSTTGESSTTNISKLQACLVPAFQIGVACSAKVPSERMNSKNVLTELLKMRNVFLNGSTSVITPPLTHSPSLN